MFYQISDFQPVPFNIRFALDNPALRPWVKYWYSIYYHDLDLYEIGRC